MRRLLLLRHGKSDWPDGIDDHERTLSRRGRPASLRIGRHMAQKGLRPDLAIVSTARRAQETWELALPAFVQDIVQRSEARVYESTAETLLEIIGETGSDVHTLLLVGHNPGLQDLALKLVPNGNRSAYLRLRRKYPTAGLLVIDLDIGGWSDASEGLGRLERFDTPKSIGNLFG